MEQRSEDEFWLVVDFDGVVGYSNQSDLISRWCHKFDIGEADVSSLLSAYRSALQTGKMDVREYWDVVCGRIGLADPEFAARTWSQIYDTVLCLDTDVTCFLQSLKRTYRLCLLSNTSQLFFNERVEGVLESVFDERIYSFQVGSKKPEHDVFCWTFEKIDTEPSRCVVVDDAEKNLTYPAQAGAKVIKYETLAKLREAIQTCSEEFEIG